MMPWLTEGRLPDARSRLFVFPHAGGAASSFAGWQGLIGDAVEVLRMQYPGRENRFRERPFTRLGALADSLAEAVAHADGRPFALFGHSMGALVATEVAHRLSEIGRGPALLAVSGSLAPMDAQGQPDDSLLSDGELVRVLGELGGTEPGMFDDPEVRQAFLPTIRADLAAVAAYQYSHTRRLVCPITGWFGDADAEISPARMARWGSLTEGGFRSRQATGGHFFLWAAADQILADIRRALEGSTGE